MTSRTPLVGAEALAQIVGSTLLKGCEVDAVTFAITFFREHYFDDRQTVFLKGDKATSLFIIAQGRVRFTRQNIQGDELLTAVLGISEWFGELSLLNNSPRSHHAQAIGDTVLLELTKPDFEQLLKAYPSVAIRLLQRSARRLQHMFWLLERSLLLPIPCRLALCLLEVAQAHDAQLVVSHSQEDLGRMIGATRQSVGRILTGWADQGILSTRYRGVEIVDFERLTKLSKANYLHNEEFETLHA
ncbi:Cyclic AMP receptor protein [Pseudomonas fluorescens]|uniref:Cyclic AMP receptor protein n=1 Tax=Pseudomonas fluorescens TaxID=294 RepID=A0A5E6SH79_PSEFL|nr:Crp/Fnr family transcriptional regulator [Pseudomonas fluorescens]VVM79502.1 Cyclic AMP receptor protein [Pseudomonas fluorescens]